MFKKNISFRDGLKEAWGSLLQNKVRSFLTFLGLTIGVLSLISVMTVIAGANEFAANKIATLGSNVFKITKVEDISKGIRAVIRSFRRKNIDYHQYQEFKRKLKSAKYIGARASRTTLVKFGNNYMEDVSIVGETSDMIYISDDTIADGRYFTKNEAFFGKSVCVIGNDIKKELFPGLDPIGKIISIRGRKFKVIGTYESKGSVLGQSMDNFVTIPISQFFKLFGSRRSLDIFVYVDNPERIDSVIEEARTIMRNIRKRRYNMEDDFTFVTSDSTMSIFHTITDNFFLVFILLSAVSAIIGGIVIMNIMLVVVTERKMEIGVRMALGATKGDILFQFLIETLIICLAGGLCGILGGFLTAKIFGQITGAPAVVKWWVALFGVLTSSSIGLFFGIYPAMKAANLNPVEAIRSEL